MGDGIGRHRLLPYTVYRQNKSTTKTTTTTYIAFVSGYLTA